MSTIAQRYTEKAKELMPEHGGRLHEVDPALDSYSKVEDVIFSRGEYLGGMAAVILKLVELDAVILKRVQKGIETDIKEVVKR